MFSFRNGTACIIKIVKNQMKRKCFLKVVLNLRLLNTKLQISLNKTCNIFKCFKLNVLLVNLV